MKGDKMKFSLTLRSLNKIMDTKSLRQLDHFSSLRPCPLTIRELLDNGRSQTEQLSFGFLRKELPVRLSNIMKEINLLPRSLLNMPSVLIVQVITSHLKLKSHNIGC